MTAATESNITGVIAVSGKSGTGMTSLCDALGSFLSQRGIVCSYVSCLFTAEAVLERAFRVDMAAIKRSNDRFAKCPDGSSWHEAVLDIDMGIRIGHNQQFVARALRDHIEREWDSGTQVVIVDDVRTPEDLAALRSLGCYAVRLGPEPKRQFVGLHRQFQAVVHPDDPTDILLDEEADWDVELAERKPVDVEAEQVVRGFLDKVAPKE